jgi:DNA-binding transcriptional MerR regulator
MSLSELAELLAPTFPACDDAPLARELLRLLACGAPVPSERLATVAGRDEEDVRATLARWPNVHRDEHQRVVAFGGLSLTRTGHRLDLGKRPLYAWCAWDTLFLPRLLDRHARVASTCPVTRAAVRLRVGPHRIVEWQPHRLWVSFPPPSQACAEGCAASFCGHVHFLAGARARDRWLAGHEKGLALGLDEAFELGRLATRAMTGAGVGGDPDLMTVGELSRRTGLSIKAIREYEGLGLIYSAGRSEGNHRMFDSSALWCARTITDLRALGLTVKEIMRIADVYLARPEEPIGPRIAAAVDDVERRAQAQVQDLLALLERIRRFRRDNADALAGRRDALIWPRDPRRIPGPS